MPRVCVSNISNDVRFIKHNYHVKMLAKNLVKHIKHCTVTKILHLGLKRALKICTMQNVEICDLCL